MRKRLAAALVSGGAIVLSLSLGATTASATSANTWTVSPGGSLSGTGTAQVKDTKTGTVAKCKTIKLAGTLKKGKGLSGTGIGSVTKASFSGCTIATISITVTIGQGSLPWKVNALSYKGGVSTGDIVGVDLVATAPGCSATLDGTAAGANNGTTKITYTNSTGKLALLGPGGSSSR